MTMRYVSRGRSAPGYHAPEKWELWNLSGGQGHCARCGKLLMAWSQYEPAEWSCGPCAVPSLRAALVDEKGTN